jgi:hypothetical protein
MNQSLVIHDLICFDKIETNQLGFLKRIGMKIVIPHKTFGFKIIFPDNKEEWHQYADIESQPVAVWIFGLSSNNKGVQFRDLTGFERLNRERVLQRVVNDLQLNGYTVVLAQLALFMSSKIDNLILSSEC